MVAYIRHRLMLSAAVTALPVSAIVVLCII